MHFNGTFYYLFRGRERSKEMIVSVLSPSMYVFVQLTGTAAN
jgi:hypothetical protein